MFKMFQTAESRKEEIENFRRDLSVEFYSILRKSGDELVFEEERAKRIVANFYSLSPEEVKFWHQANAEYLYNQIFIKKDAEDNSPEWARNTIYKQHLEMVKKFFKEGKFDEAMNQMAEDIIEFSENDEAKKNTLAKFLMVPIEEFNKSTRFFSRKSGSLIFQLIAYTTAVVATVYFMAANAAILLQALKQGSFALLPMLPSTLSTVAGYVDEAGRPAQVNAAVAVAAPIDKIDKSPQIRQEADLKQGADSGFGKRSEAMILSKSAPAPAQADYLEIRISEKSKQVQSFESLRDQSNRALGQSQAELEAAKKALKDLNDRAALASSQAGANELKSLINKRSPLSPSEAARRDYLQPRPPKDVEAERRLLAAALAHKQEMVAISEKGLTEVKQSLSSVVSEKQKLEASLQASKAVEKREEPREVVKEVSSDGKPKEAGAKEDARDSKSADTDVDKKSEKDSAEAKEKAEKKAAAPATPQRQANVYDFMIAIGGAMFVTFGLVKLVDIANQYKEFLGAGMMAERFSKAVSQAAENKFKI